MDQTPTDIVDQLRSWADERARAAQMIELQGSTGTAALRRQQARMLMMAASEIERLRLSTAKRMAEHLRGSITAPLGMGISFEPSTYGLILKVQWEGAIWSVLVPSAVFAKGFDHVQAWAMVNGSALVELAQAGLMYTPLRMPPPVVTSEESKA